MMLLSPLAFFKVWFRTSMILLLRVLKNCYMSLVLEPEKIYTLFRKKEGCLAMVNTEENGSLQKSYNC